MKYNLLGVLFLVAAAFAVSACDRGDSVGSKEEPRGEASRSATGAAGKAAEDSGRLAQRDMTEAPGKAQTEPGATSQAPAGASGEPAKAGEPSKADPSESVKESVFGDTEAEKRQQAQAEKAQEGATAEPAEAGKTQQPRGGGDVQTERETAATGAPAAQAKAGTEAAPTGVESGEPGQAGQRATGAAQSQARASQQDVRQAQQALKEQGQDPGPIDGIMGPQTRRALREFQEKQGLEQTGTLDAETRRALNIAGSSGSQGAANPATQAEPQGK